MSKDVQSTAFVSLYAKHHLNLLRYVLTLLPDRNQAEDVVQETARLLWQKFDQYNPDQPFWPWARQFAYFEVLKHRKKHAQKRRIFSDELVELLAEDQVKQEDYLDAQRQALSRCMGRLDDNARQMLMDRYSDDISLNELAQRMGKSPNALSLKMHRLRQKLLECAQRVLRKGGWSE